MRNTNWSTETIENCLQRFPSSNGPKLTTSQYKTAGLYPIIDQGQKMIAGWTDDKEAVISGPLPVIVFGDHTRTLKFVDFPFARGADGTQIMMPRSNIDPLFFFYACRSVDLPSRGYNRHFTSLKEKTIPLPDTIEEQARIGQLLRDTEAAEQRQQLLLDRLHELKRAVTRELFNHGLRAKLQKETEIGPIPECWGLETIDAHFSVVSGGTPARGVLEYWTNGDIPWVKTTEIAYNEIMSTSEYITAAGLANSSAKLLKPGTLLLAMYGQGVTRGKVAILGIEAACNQACAALNPLDDQVETRFLYHYLAYRYEQVRQAAHGGQQQNLNLDIVRKLPLVVPKEKEEQKEITSVLDAIDKKLALNKQKKDVLQKLLQALLHKLMTAEIRVGDLDLSAIEPEKAIEVSA